MGYWTDKRRVGTSTEIINHAMSGDGHSFNDVYEEEIRTRPIYASRLGTLTRSIFGVGLLGLLVFGGAKCVQFHIQEKERKARTRENQLMIYRVEKIAQGGDYSFSNEEGRKFIDELGLLHPEEGNEHLLRFYATENGAKWNFESTPWNRNYLGEIPREKLENYLERYGEK